MTQFSIVDLVSGATAQSNRAIQPRNKRPSFCRPISSARAAGCPKVFRFTPSAIPARSKRSVLLPPFFQLVANAAFYPSQNPGCPQKLRFTRSTFAAAPKRRSLPRPESRAGQNAPFYPVRAAFLPQNQRFARPAVDCGDTSPLSDWETCLPVPKRGHARALHKIPSANQQINQ